MNASPRAVDLTITGHVQGVSFRAYTVDRARELGLIGWVENLDDGSVHVRAQGDPDAVESLVDWCHDGPSAARVDDVEVRDVAPESVDDFSVRR
ncbi:acylphosphatase [Dermacoccus barathri]|uniref:acylphosphatase n=1 Tax=Dermacoccus barathri TaxID=322601 RepID=UPI00187A330E|nr:acylphosphatase [Dermacoccus barathri]MBE7372373.1 acylphosphatase [Dermacoccus barathri]